jgi:integrase
MLPEAPARQPALTADEESRLMEACTPSWLRLLVRVAIGTGMRQGEVLALKWGDLDTDAGEAIVRDSKSGRSRRVPVHPAVLAELAELRKARERAADEAHGTGVRDLQHRREIPEASIVLTDEGESPTSNATVQAFARARRRIGRDDLHFHDLRHVYASRLLGAGASLPEVADTLGHRTLHMAKRYAHTNPARLRSLVAVIELADNGAAKPAGDNAKGEGKE